MPYPACFGPPYLSGIEDSDFQVNFNIQEKMAKVKKNKLIFKKYTEDGRKGQLSKMNFHDKSLHGSRTHLEITHLPACHHWCGIFLTKRS